jgi:hypothetical protein
MSSEEDKLKHSKRLHKEDASIKRQIKLAKEYGIPVKEPHKLHKMRLLNCGNPNCVMCMNPRKSFGEKTMQERKFEQMEKHYDTTIEQPSGSSED